MKRFLRHVLSAIASVVVYLGGSSQQLVLRGDYPDPSVVKIGDTYWATATTSNWAPAFPLLKSTDLVNWELVANVFPELPAWADYYFWAPEISYDNNKVYIYYSAHKRGGNLCVGIASADKPEGPYRDHGPIICQDVGSIDAFPMRDRNGKLHMIWKEDGNSVRKPTPIWIQELNEERTTLVGERKMLFQNDAVWEGNLVEGVSMIRHGDYYYAFYAAAACCGRGCDYATGIARSKDLHGPWLKYDKNPVITTSSEWKCPGHGTPVEKDGRNYFLYHAYSTRGDVYAGRQGLLAEFHFLPDGWIKFDTTGAESAPPPRLTEEFESPTLSTSWQWSVFDTPHVSIRRGCLFLSTTGKSFIAQKIITSSYTATTKVDVRKSSGAAGLAAIGDDKNMVGVFVSENGVTVMQTKNGVDSTHISSSVTGARDIYLRIEADGRHIRFSYSKNGRDFIPLTRDPVDGFFLPPWDRAVRIGLVAKQGLAVFHKITASFN